MAWPAPGLLTGPFLFCPEFRPPKIKFTTCVRKCATIVIILSARSRCAHEKWGKSEASSSASPKEERRGARAQVVRNPHQRQDLAFPETALAPWWKSCCECPVLRSRELPPKLEVVPGTPNRARVLWRRVRGSHFVRFSDHHHSVCFTASCFRSHRLSGRKRSATQTNAAGA